jgi:hypothetical protein
VEISRGGTAEMPVVIALRPGRGAGSMRKEKKFRSSKSRPAPRQGRDRSALRYRRFHAGYFPPPFQGEKQELVISKELGNDKSSKRGPSA